MEESTKKTIMIVVVVVSLVAAGAITYMSRSKRGVVRLPPNAMIWVKCTNTDCNTAYEISMKEYTERMQENTSMNTMGPTPIRCEKCGKNTAYLAEKCEKCGLVFIRERVPAALGDKCPGCGYSKSEAAGKKDRGE